MFPYANALADAITVAIAGITAYIATLGLSDVWRAAVRWWKG